MGRLTLDIYVPPLVGYWKTCSPEVGGELAPRMEAPVGGRGEGVKWRPSSSGAVPPPSR